MLHLGLLVTLLQWQAWAVQPHAQQRKQQQQQQEHYLQQGLQKLPLLPLLLVPHRKS